MGPPSYMRSVVDRNVVMRCIPVLLLRLSTGRVQKNRHQVPGSFLVYLNFPLNFDLSNVKHFSLYLMFS
jgi:hypothetical protein